MNRLCQCGCGLPAPIATQSNTRDGHVKGQPMRFIVGHNARRPRRRGYAMRLSPSGELVAVHVSVAEQALGRVLPTRAQVHHVDENITNNANGNLVICQDAAYHRLLHARTLVVRAGGDPNTQRWCGSCRQAKDLNDFARSATNKHSGRVSRCRACGAVAFKAWSQKAQATNGL